MVLLSSRITVPTKNPPKPNKDIMGSSESAKSSIAVSSIVATVASPRAFTRNIWSPRRLPIAGGLPPQSINIEEIEYWKAFEEEITNVVLRSSTPSDIVATNLSNNYLTTARRVYYHCEVTAHARPTDALSSSTYLPDSQLRAYAQSWYTRQLTRPLAIAARALQFTRFTARALYLPSPPHDLFTRTARERVLPNNDVIARAHLQKFDTIASSQTGHSP